MFSISKLNVISLFIILVQILQIFAGNQMTQKLLLILIVLLTIVKSIRVDKSTQVSRILQQDTNKKLSNLVYCGDTLTSQFIAEVSKYKRDQQLQNVILKMFPANRNLLVQGILNTDSAKVWQSIRPNIGQYILHIGIILVFALIFVILIPILLCTKCCIACKCCAKNQNQNYQRCQLLFPIIIAALFLIALIVICSITLFIRRSFEEDYNRFKCSLSLIGYNLLEGGNYDNGNVKFVGFRNFRNSITLFQNDLNKINSSLQLLTSTNKPIKTLDQLLSKMIDVSEKIPSQSKQSLVLNYPRPLTSVVEEARQDSLFPDILGTSQQQNSLVSNLTTATKQKQINIGLLNSVGSNFSSIGKNVNTTFEQVKQKINPVVRQVQSLEYNILNSISLVQNGVFVVEKIGSYVILGLTIFCAVVILFAICCLGAYNKIGCNGILCSFCVAIWILGILHFAIAIGFSLVNAGFIHGCNYAREGLQSNAGFKNNILKFIKTDNNQLTSMADKCLSNSKEPYYFYDTMANNLQTQNIDKLRQILPDYNPEKDAAELSGNYSSLLKTTQQYRVAQIVDVQNPTMINQLRDMANTQNCWSDSWVPSLKQNPTVIQCTLTQNQTNKVDNSTCKNLDDFKSRANGCFGCIDSFLITQQFNNITQLQQSLNQRYEQCTSGQKDKITNLTLIWKNFYNVKKNRIGEVKARAVLFQQPLKQTNKIIKQVVNTNYRSAYSLLQSQSLLKTQSAKNSADSSNSTDSSVAPRVLSIRNQMDCRVLGKSLDISVNIICTQGLNYAFLYRIYYIVSSFLIFFICCFLVCIFSRYNHQTKVNSHTYQYKNHHGQNNQQLRNVQMQMPTSQRKFTVQQYQTVKTTNKKYFS